MGARRRQTFDASPALWALAAAAALAAAVALVLHVVGGF